MRQNLHSLFLLLACFGFLSLTLQAQNPSIRSNRNGNISEMSTNSPQRQLPLFGATQGQRPYYSLPAHAASPLNQGAAIHQRAFAQPASARTAGQVTGTPLSGQRNASASVLNALAAGPCDTILFEDFQSQLIPATWTNLDVDAATDANGRPGDFHVIYDEQLTLPLDTNWAAAASSWFTPSGTANNWLITPQINICAATVQMIWKSAPFEGPGWMDGYEVLISTTGNAPANFTTQLALFAEDVSGTGAGTPGPGIVHSNFNAGRGVLTESSVSLAAYNGLNVYIAFHHTSNDDNLILLDDIFIGSLPTNDLAIDSSTFGEYVITPTRHVQSMTFGAEIVNTGGTSVTNPTLDVVVNDGVSNVYTGSGSSASVAPFTTIFETTTPTFTPASVATYTASYQVSGMQTDPNPANDTISRQFGVSADYYQRDNNTLDGILSIGPTTYGLLGQEYDIIQQDTLNAVTFYLAASVIGDSLTAKVYSMGASQPNIEVATSALYVTTAADTGGVFVTMPIIGSYAMSPGAYFIGIEESVASEATLGYSFDVFTPGRTWVFFNSAWNNSENFGFLPAYLIRPQFQGAASSGPCADTLLFEDFQSQAIPALWGNLDVDGLTDANARPANWHVIADLETTLPADTNYVAASSSWFSPSGTADNWLILPAIAVCDTNIDLYWKSAPFEGLPWMDGYEVLVSTTGNLPANFTTQLEQFAEDTTAGLGMPGPGIAHSNFNNGRGVLQQWTADLSAYNGQSIYIAFHHTSNDDNLILLDDILISRPFTPPAGDITMVEGFHDHEYPITPLDHVQSMIYTGRVGNSGSTVLTSPALNVAGDRNGTPVYTGTGSISTLGIGMDSLLTASPNYIPTDTGLHTLVYEASHASVDANLTDNFDTLTYLVTDTVYSRDNNVLGGNLSIGPTSDGILGQEYDIIVTDDLTSVTFWLDGPTVGDTIFGVVYNMGATPTTEISRTDTLIVPSATPAFYTLVFPSAVTLTPGSYYVGLYESTTSQATLGYSTDHFTLGRTWVFFNGTWATSETYSFFPSYILRANFGAPCVAPVAAFSSASTSLTATFTDAATNSPSSYLWDFGDGNLSTLSNPTHTYSAAGTYTVCQTVMNSCGTDSTCQTVVITCQAPVSAFSQTSSNLMATFTDAATNSPTSYLWDFGDGNTSTQASPSHTYAATGTYTVCQVVTNSCGSDSSCQSVVVTCAAPSAAWSFLQNGNLTYDFTDGSTVNGSASYAWDFGDGNTSTSASPSHTYALGGNYTVCMTVTDICGQDSMCSSLTVVGIESELAAGISIYPNPSRGQFSVDINLSQSDDLRFSLVNVVGQVLLTKELSQVSNEKVDFDLQNISAGVYFLRVSSTKANLVRRIEVMN